MGCGGSKNAKVYADEDAFESVRVNFIWPNANAPQAVEWRGTDFKSMKAGWNKLDYKTGSVSATSAELPAGTLTTRWLGADGKYYLTPKDLAPTLLRKFLENDKVKELLSVGGQELKWDQSKDPSIKDLPDSKLKEVLITLEGLLPYNKFNIGGIAKVKRGKWIKGDRQLSLTEKAMEEKDKIMSDPKKAIPINRGIKKAQVEAVKAAIEQLGISFADLVPDMDEVFGLKVDGAELDNKVADLTEYDPSEPLSEDELKSIEQGSYAFTSTAIARFCAADIKAARVPVRFEWNVAEESAAEVKVRWWTVDFADKELKEFKATTAPQESVLIPKQYRPKKNEKEKSAEEIEKIKAKLVGKEVLVNLPVGTIAYQFVLDNKVFLDAGDPIPDDADSAQCFKVLDTNVVEPIFE